MASGEELVTKSDKTLEIGADAPEGGSEKHIGDASATGNSSDETSHVEKVEPDVGPNVNEESESLQSAEAQNCESDTKELESQMTDTQQVSKDEAIQESVGQETGTGVLLEGNTSESSETKYEKDSTGAFENADRGDFEASSDVKPETAEEMDVSEPSDETKAADLKDDAKKDLPADIMVGTTPADQACVSQADDVSPTGPEHVKTSVSNATAVQIDLQISPISSESGLAREVEQIMKSECAATPESDKVGEDDAGAKKTTSSSDLSDQSAGTSVSEKSECAMETDASCPTTQSFVKLPTPQDPAFKLPKGTDNQETKEQGQSYANEFEKFLHFAKEDEKAAEGESSPVDLPTDSKSGAQKTFKRKVYEMDESDSSSWYKPPKNGTDPAASGSFGANKELMHTAVRRLLPQDENSNSSMPDSITGCSFPEENSCLSSQDEISNMDETSNMSITDTFLAPDFHRKPDISLFDESANLNPPNNKSFVRSDTPTSVVSESTTPKRVRRGTLAIAAEEASEHRHDLTARDLFEYQWPQESGAEWYMLQEQISTYLDVKSFKRKYPDLFRRVCDKLEKEFLREKGVVSETQSDLGLTAVKSEEIHELMNKDYPEKYQEYCVVLHEKERQHIEDKHKDYDVPQVEKGKIKEYTRKAMKSAAEWNLSLQRERKEERRAYFDMQTFVMHFPQSKYRRAPPEATKVSAYPVSLIPGQYQEYCKRYSAEELKYFPLNTAMFDPPKKMDHLTKQTTPEPDSDNQEEKRQSVAGSASESDDDSSSNSDASSVAVSQTNTIQGCSVKLEPCDPPPEPAVKASCRICSESKDKKKKAKKDEELVQCSECKRSGHPSCLDLTPDMVQVINTYPWQCMECKTCVECMDPYDEDKMLFCDRCDRGYHTFCVGLKSLPTGSWECTSCKSDTASTRSSSQKATPKSTSKSRRSRK